MIFQIKIDRRTLKKNPNAGSTITYLPGIIEATFEYNGKELPSYLKEDKNCFITSWCSESDITKFVRFDTIKGVIIKPVTAKLMKKAQQDENFSILIEREVNKIEHQPEPDYFYKYRKTKVQCDECEGIFDHNELQSDSYMDVYSDMICPLCGEWDCCQLKYESL